MTLERFLNGTGARSITPGYSLSGVLLIIGNALWIIAIIFATLSAGPTWNAAFSGK